MADDMKTVAELINGLENGKEAVRDASAEALGLIGPEAVAAVPALADALEDEDEGVRETAAWALGLIGPQAVEAVPALATALTKDARWRVRWSIARSLGWIGPTKDVLPALMTATADQMPAVRSAAEEALRAIRGRR